MIKIPGTAEGVGPIEEAHRRRDQRQRHAAVRRRGLREVAEAYIRGHGAPPARRASRSTCTPSRRSSSRASTPRSTSAWRSSARTTSCRARPASPTPAPPTSASRRSSTASASPRCARPARRSSARCGPRPATKNPDYPDTLYVDNLAGPETVNTMPMATLLAAAERGEVGGPDGCDADPTEDLQALADAGIDMDDVTDQLLREGIDDVREAARQAARRHRVQARGGRHRPPDDVRVQHPRRARGRDRRARRAGRRRGRRPADLGQGRDAVGARGHARGRRPARLADHRRPHARRGATS